MRITNLIDLIFPNSSNPASDISSFYFQGLIVIGGEDESHPSKVRLFKNRPNMTFDQAATKGMDIKS